MILVIGLGNPGEKYKKTWHNLGFITADELQDSNEFSNWKLKTRFKAEISEGALGDEKTILAKPQTFMNKSGQAVKKIVSNYKLQVSPKITSPGLVVVHDDIDLPLGKIRIIKNRGSAGHKGVQSIIDELGTKNFIRVRIGVEPKQHFQSAFAAEKFVCQKFQEKEEIIKKIVKNAAAAIVIAATKGIEEAMNKFN